MYLTAHHVVSAKEPREGVNVFLYLHGGLSWGGDVPPGIPDRDPGTLKAQSISVSPPGNRVLSYLDIVAPDDVRWEEIHVGLMEFVGHCQSQPLPWHGHSGRCSFTVSIDAGLTERWQKELAILYRAAQALRLAHGA